MTYSLRELLPVRFGEISDKWKEIAGDDEFKSELKLPLDHILAMMNAGASQISDLAPDASVLEVYDSFSNEPVAIVDLINSERQQLTKILKFVLSPKFWTQNGQTSPRHAIAQIHTDTYTQIIESKMYEGSAQEVKIYGRDDVIFSLLQMIHDNWDSRTGLRVALQGRWLSVTKETSDPVQPSVEG